METKDFECDHEIACRGYFTQDKLEKEKKLSALFLKNWTQG